MHFALITKRHRRVYDDFINSQRTNHLRQFVSLNSDQYPTLNALITSTALFPGSALLFKYSQFVDSLRRFMECTERTIIRGHHLSTAQDVVSIMLQSDIYIACLVLVFDESGFTNIRLLYANWPYLAGYDVATSLIMFDIRDLNELLKHRKWIQNVHGWSPIIWEMRNWPVEPKMECIETFFIFAVLCVAIVVFIVITIIH